MSQYPRLLKRHAAFLAVLITFVTIAAQVIPHPDGWIGSSRGDDWPYSFMAIPIGILAVTEIVMNRGLLERAHDERFGGAPGTDEPARDGTLSISGQDR
jgi:hypothetical protein